MMTTSLLRQLTIETSQEGSKPVFEEIKKSGASSPMAPHSLLINDSWVFAMDSLFNAICVLVTAALVLTFVPGLMLRERFPISMGDRGRALLVCVVLGLRRRLQILFGRSFQLEVRSELGQGTMITIRIPLQTPSRNLVSV